jgi:hypothetical protein
MTNSLTDLLKKNLKPWTKYLLGMKLAKHLNFAWPKSDIEYLFQWKLFHLANTIFSTLFNIAI